jgi:excisionase family DNA binding protein
LNDERGRKPTKTKEEVKCMQRLYTVKEIAEYLGVTTQSVHNWLKAGRLQAVRPTERIIRIPEKSLQQFMEGGDYYL